VQLEGVDKLIKKIIHLIETGTWGLLACRIVPQPFTLDLNSARSRLQPLTSSVKVKVSVT
jgi:hypothetical protein